MIKVLNNITKNNASLPLFFVFTAEFLGPLACKGNPALVINTNELPSLKEHLEFIRSVQRDSAQQTLLPDNVTFSYISTHNSGELTDTREFSIRWFSSTSIIQRCGHGTLAAAAFVDGHIIKSPPTLPSDTCIRFYSDKEELNVAIHSNGNLSNLAKQYSLRLKHEVLLPSDHQKYFNNKIVRENKTPDEDGYLIIELNCEREVKDFILTQTIISIINKRALIITAKSQSKDYDIVFRYFAPFYGELEDSATGSAGSLLMPFWQQAYLNAAKQPTIGQQNNSTDNQVLSVPLRCYQASENGGFFTLYNNEYPSYKENTVVVAGYIKEAKY